MKQAIFVGEAKVGGGCVHQADLAEAMGVERLKTLPKDTTNLKVIVGRPLRGKLPAIVAKAEAKDVPVLKVEDVLANTMNKAIVRKLVAILQGREENGKLYGYERAALTELQQNVKLRRKTSKAKVA